jgi:hypothetical protein
LSATERAALPVIANWTAADMVSPNGVKRAIEQNKNTGIVDGYGATYNSFSGAITEYTCRAPGYAMGDAQGRQTISNQVLASSTNATDGLNELRQRVGNGIEIFNMSETLTVQHRDGVTGLIPSRAQLYTWTLDNTVAGPNGVNRIVYNTSVKWLLETVSYVMEGNGKIQVTGKYRRLSRIGDLGDNTTPAPTNIVVPVVPILPVPAFPTDNPEIVIPDAGVAALPPTTPTPGKVSSFTGQELLAMSDDDVFWLWDFVNLTTPHARSIKPPSLGSSLIKSVLVDPFYTDTSIPAYVLTYDGTHSAVQYTVNAAVPVPAWLLGANLTGLYKTLRGTSANGTLFAFGSGTGERFDFNFLASDGGWVSFSRTEICAPETTPYSAGNGWGYYQCTDGINYGTYVEIEYVLPAPADLTEVAITANLSSPGAAGNLMNIYVVQAGVETQIATFNEPGAGNRILAITGTWANVSAIRARVGLTLAPSAYITAATYVTSSTGSSSTVAVSTDHGMTWASPLTVGTATVPVYGFDCQPAGTVSYAGCEGKVREATTLGGAYADWYSVPSSANPVCIILPWYRRNSSTRNTAVSDPDVLAGCDNGKLYWIDGTTATATDITPPGMTAFTHADCITTRWGNEIAVWGEVSGVPHLFHSFNGGTSWTDNGVISGAGKIRCRRRDNRKSPNGQVYLVQSGGIGYSSKFTVSGGSLAGLWPRNMPTPYIVSFDSVW